MVSREQAIQFAKDNCIDYYIETSAKSGENTSYLFLRAAKVLYTEYKNYKNMYNSSLNSQSVFNSEDTRNSFKLNNKGRKEGSGLNKESDTIKEDSGCSC